jgi:GT2 family glycosyltransferase
MLSQNAFSHLGVLRRSLVEKVGRFREGYEGAQDHDLVLRCADETVPGRIRHIPRVLYHWRASKHSTATGLASKSYAANAGHMTIKDTLRRRGIEGHVEPAPGGFYRVSYEMPDPPPLVSIIVLTTLRNQVAPRCLHSVLTKTRYRNIELLLVASEDDLAAQRTKFNDLVSDPRVRTLAYSPSAFNFARGNNLGMTKTRGSLLCFLNDDVEVIGEDWLEQLVTRVAVGGAAAAGPMLYYPSDLIQHAGVLLGVGGVADHAFRNVERGHHGYFTRAALEQDYTCLTAACLLIRREVCDAVGGFDETLPSAFNDVDLCIRIRRAGGRIVWTPSAQLYHHESLTYGAPDEPGRTAQFARDIAVIRSRWQAALDNDPSYNPNLSLEREHQFELAAVPRTAFASSDKCFDLHKSVSRTGLLP